MLSGQAEALGSTLLRPTVALVSMTRKHKKTPKLTRTAISSRTNAFRGRSYCHCALFCPCAWQKNYIYIFIL